MYYVKRGVETVATFMYAEDAALFVGNGGGEIIEDAARRVLWNDDAEEQRAAESFDEAAEIIRKREDE